ncbi:DUF2062 domain-containing protein [Holophaga foetida]|uniref:DUF2062 domain-containing protein n=1 Tax=Holophaga foetida TaxID=35839 RepID=UPI0002472145|nr:DUF2062 domain-containing protein [Holophaga foetida]
MTDIPVASPKPSLWARLKSHILHPELSPNVVAWSFAIGFSIAWNPLLGLHTWMVILLCLIFRRLHRPLMFIAAFINNPWTMVPMATASVFLGNALLGRGWHVSLQGIRWHEIGWRSFVTREGFRATYQMIEPILAPYLLGGAVLSLLAIPVGYFVMRKFTERLRRMHLHMPHVHLHHKHPDKQD